MAHELHLIRVNVQMVLDRVLALEARLGGGAQ